jgi:hypothetical protein
MSIWSVGQLLSSILLLGVLCTRGEAQAITGWGLKAGMTSAIVSQSIGQIDYSFPSRTGLNVGIFAEWFDHPWFGVSSEICYNQKGLTIEAPITTPEFPDGTGESIRESVCLHYLSIAVLPRAKLPLGVVEIYGVAGPRLDLSVGRSVSVDANGSIRSYLERAWNSRFDEYEDYQVGADIGFGLIVNKVLPFDLGVEARYSLDFTASLKALNYSARNSSWELMLVARL